MESCQDFKFLCQDPQLFWWEVAGVMGSVYSFGKETSSISHSLWGCSTSLEWGQLSQIVAHPKFLTKAALHSMGRDLAAPFLGQGVSSSKGKGSKQDGVICNQNNSASPESPFVNTVQEVNGKRKIWYGYWNLKLEPQSFRGREWLGLEPLEFNLSNSPAQAGTPGASFTGTCPAAFWISPSVKKLQWTPPCKNGHCK